MTSGPILQSGMNMRDFSATARRALTCFARALLLLYNHPDNGKAMPENIQGSMIKYKTGVDLHTNWTLDFPRIGKAGARACLSTSIGVNSPKEVVTRITGTAGYAIFIAK